MNKINLVSLNHSKDNLSDVKLFGKENAEKVNKFHASFPEYKVTPLVELNDLANKLNIKNIFVKDESFRFDLNAFKVLGGSFAIGNYIANKLNMDINELPYERMISDEIRNKLGNTTFITATDGNHGRGVAWTANRLKQKSIVYMPSGSAIERLNNIKALGSDASITDLNYDDAVRLANTKAKENGYVLVQDTTLPGYVDIPTWIMQGYTTMGYEINNQLTGIKPTHIFLQAGVGAMAGAICAYFTDLYGEENRPIISIVEPNKANCIYETAKANDNELHYIKGEMDSIMAGLCCGEPCSIAWNILKDHADYFISIEDIVAAEGMRVLAKNNIVSGESGAATTGLVYEVLSNNEYKDIKDKLKLNENSIVLCISTEGDTDKENYQNIINNKIFKN